MAAQTITEAKKLTNWVDGLPSADLKQDSVKLGELTYWVDGMPYATVYPSSGTRVSDFMFFMPF